MFTYKKVSNYDFKQYRLLKFSKSPKLKLSGVLHTFFFGGGSLISAIGKLPFWPKIFCAYESENSNNLKNHWKTREKLKKKKPNLTKKLKKYIKKNVISGPKFSRSKSEKFSLLKKFLK